MEDKHTPGPWRDGIYSKDNRGGWFTWVGPDSGDGIARVHSHTILISETQANARLIAAAPKMLEALRIAHPHPARQHEPGEMPESCVICAAIAEAEGR